MGQRFKARIPGLRRLQASVIGQIDSGYVAVPLK
jgi:hypothetical protein